MTGKRKGRESQIQIKTVNQNDILPSEQDLKYNAQPISTPKFVNNASQVIYKIRRVNNSYIKNNQLFFNY